MIRAVVIAAALLVAPCAVEAQVIVPSGDVTLQWDYEPSEMTTQTTFIIYHTTNATLNLTNWPMLTNFPAVTNRVKVNIVPGEHYFVLTASNFWNSKGFESGFSNVAGTPPLARQVTNILITKLP